MKNTILIPIVTISFFFSAEFYWAMPNGPNYRRSGFRGGRIWCELALPWSSAMAVNLGDRINLVFGLLLFYFLGLRHLLYPGQ